MENKIINVFGQLNSKEALIPLKLEEIEFIVVHHVEAINYTWEQCNADHKKNGWACAGYNEMIYKNGDVYAIRGDFVGAHCKGYNTVSYGIALAGNYNIETEIPQAQLNSLVNRIIFHEKRLPKYVKLVEHKQLFDTECAGRYFNLELVKAKIEEVKKIEMEKEKNKQLEEEKVKKLEEIADINKENISKLAENGIINSPEYWEKASKGNIAKLIENMANFIEKEIK